MNPIVGPRWKRGEEDYDLCSADYSKLSKEEKKRFQRVRKRKTYTFGLQQEIELPPCLRTCEWPEQKLMEVHTIRLTLKRLNCLPSTLWRLKNLRQLIASANGIWNISPNIGKLIMLFRIDIRYNRLKQLPDEIGLLHNLKYLDGCQNRIETLTDAIGNLRKLEVLNLYETN